MSVSKNTDAGAAREICGLRDKDSHEILVKRGG